MSKITLKTFVACLITVITTAAHAQIVLHEATDVTQTKATLSADFPDLSVEHGFQYKYGTLPEIDEFSRLALSSVSDPVQINTTGNAWSARTVKGWVESKSNLSVGQASIMSAKVKFSEPTTVTFEWSVDSEEGIGILSFIVDGKTVREISGAVDFTQVSYQATTGEHTLQWQYKKTAATNVGLDLGMVRNIDLQNTTEGEWINVKTGSRLYTLNNLMPTFNYVYRAFCKKNGGTFLSSIKGFKTEDVILRNLSISSVDYTSATFTLNTDIGDAFGQQFIHIGEYEPVENAIEGQVFTRNSPEPVHVVCNGWEIRYGSYLWSNNGSITTEVDIIKDTEFSFCYEELYTQGEHYGLFVLLDGIIVRKIQGTSKNRKEISIPIKKGKHTIVLRIGKYYDGPGFVIGTGQARCELYNFKIQNTFSPKKTTIKDCKFDHVVNGEESQISVDLYPGRKYTAYVKYLYKGVNATDSIVFTSDVKIFETLQISNSSQVKECNQASALIVNKAKFGKAQVISAGLQYRDASSERWTDYPQKVSEEDVLLRIERLKPNTTYRYRSYIQAQDCDTVFSETKSFTTKIVQALKPTLVNVFIHSAELQGKVIFGDANIYQHGMQFRKVGTTEWENLEKGENDSIYTVLKEALELNTKYETRTYIQPAGCDIIYSDILEFCTLHYISNKSLPEITTTQTTATVLIRLSETDEVFDEVGIYYGKDYSQMGKITGIIEDKCFKVKILGLDCSNSYYYRPYVKKGERYYIFDNWGKDAVFTTKAVTIPATFTNITQTKATMKVSVNAGDAEVTDLKYRLNYGEYADCGETVNFNGLTPGTQYTIRFSGKVNGKDCYWETQPNTSNAYKFTTKTVSVSAHSSAIEQTSATISWSYNCGDATYVSSGIEYGTTTAMTKSASNEDGEIRLTELMPNTTYHYCAYVETEEGGKEYSSRNSFSTSAISCATLPVSNISNRSATMNGTIDCDGYSSAEFGFQWKQMEGWNSDPAFTNGVKKEDGSISVALVNGMLEPNTDYQYRAAVRYKGNIYYASNWETFRTESEFVYYPASVYTIYRTDRENNCLVLCGYYVAGSEDVVAQGYEYWNTSAPAHSNRTYAAANNVIQITTDESMQYSLDLKTLVDGNYSVRAFVKTSSGATIYGETLAFGVQGGAITGIDNVETEGVSYSISNGILSIYNAADMSCTIYNLQGQIVECRQSMTDNEQFHLASRVVYIVRLSNGIVYKIRI